MDAASDPRFRHVATDPRFKVDPLHSVLLEAIPKRARKVKIDPRFQSMFADKRFKVKYSVDKRGKKVRQTSNEDLRKYYQLEEEEVPEEAVKKRKTGDNLSECHDTPNFGGYPNDVIDSGGESPDESSGNESGSEAGDSDSSSTDVDEDLFLNQSEEVVHGWGELDAGVPQRDEGSKRLAVCNADWDRLSAQDLYVLLSSFKPQGGTIHSVSIFPSDFGLQRMGREDVQGPVELVEGEGVEGGGYSDEKLRQYQLNRLKYYYAVVACESIETAEHIYEQCDGLEYEHSGGKLDLRFIPDEMTFDDREAKSVANESLISADFKPSAEFFSSALQQSKVRLTWDETDPKRLHTTMRKFTKDDMQSMEFSAYLASSSGEEEESEGEEDTTVTEDQIQKYRSLLGEVKGSDDDHDGDEELEITWEPGLQSTAEDLVKRKVALGGGQETPWEKYRKERRLKRAEKKRKSKKGGKGKDQSEEPELGFDDQFFQHDITMATAHSSKKGKKSRVVEEDGGGLELLVMDDEVEGREHFSLKGILKQEKAEGGRGKRRKRKKEEVLSSDTFNVDVQDPRFAAMYESHLYAPDPANPQYKPTKAMAAIMAERQRRREHADRDEKRKNFGDPSIGSLVKSVKSKASSFKQHKKELRAKRPKTHT